MVIRKLFSAFLIWFFAASGGQAATFNIVGSFNGGQLGDVSFDIEITGDFTSDIADTASGLTINSLSSSVVGGDPFSVSGGLEYTYTSVRDRLIIGGASNSVGRISGDETDFLVVIFDLFNSPRTLLAFDTYAQQTETSGDLRNSVKVEQVSPSAVPLPASLPLLFAGVVGMAALRRKSSSRRATKTMC